MTNPNEQTQFDLALNDTSAELEVIAEDTLATEEAALADEQRDDAW